MKIYPAIDLHLGNAVRLYKGDYNQVTNYGTPKEVALQFKNEGATFLHLVDLDGAKDGKFENLEAVKQILSTGIKAELGGGIRTIEHIKTLLDLGLERVILGSSALNLDFVKEAVDKFGSDKIVVGIDGTINISGSNNYDVGTTNNTRNINLNIRINDLLII